MEGANSDSAVDCVAMKVAVGVNEEAAGDKVFTVGQVDRGIIGVKVKAVEDTVLFAVVVSDEGVKVDIGTKETLVLPQVNVATPEVIKLAEILFMNGGLEAVGVIVGKETAVVGSEGLLVLVLLRGLTEELLFSGSTELLQ